MTYARSSGDTSAGAGTSNAVVVASSSTARTGTPVSAKVPASAAVVSTRVAPDSLTSRESRPGGSSGDSGR
jgi:microcompartment protein CcmK/EutM